MKDDRFYKEHDRDSIWWVKDSPKGEWEFSFDKQKVYNMFRDYPYNMTPAQVRIFDRENPFWAEYFKDRKEA